MHHYNVSLNGLPHCNVRAALHYTDVSLLVMMFILQNHYQKK